MSRLTKRATRDSLSKPSTRFRKLLDIQIRFLSTSGTNEPVSVLNPFDLRFNRGPAAFNLKHQFNANYTYQLPLGAASTSEAKPAGWRTN